MELPLTEYPISQPFVQPRKPQFSLIITLSAALLASTGTGLSLSNTNNLSLVATFPVLTFVDYDKATKEVAIAHHDLLLHIRDSFRMSMTELAGVLSVSRAALYAWFKDVTPRQDLLDRLWRLKHHADAVAVLKIERLDLLLRVPLSGGKTILQVLVSDHEVEKAINELAILSISRTAALDQIRRNPMKAKVHTVEEVSSVVIDI